MKPEWPIILLFNGIYAVDKCDRELRHIEVWDEENQRMIALLTNHLSFDSTTIAALYHSPEFWTAEREGSSKFLS